MDNYHKLAISGSSRDDVIAVQVPVGYYERESNEISPSTFFKDSVDVESIEQEGKNLYWIKPLLTIFMTRSDILDGDALKL